LVGIESVGRSADEARRRQKGQGCGRSQIAVVLHCIWTDGTCFEWGKEKMA
jgi:hypothetical protein